MKLVREYGIKQWALIGRKLCEIYGIKGRTGKQCRERWLNHINPQVNQNDIDHEEEGLIFKAIRKYGTKWAEIAKDIPGRTDNIVKNHFYSIIRKELRRIKKYLKQDIPVYENITIESIYEILKKYNVPLTVLGNENLINEIYHLGGEELSLNILLLPNGSNPPQNKNNGTKKEELIQNSETLEILKEQLSDKLKNSKYIFEKTQNNFISKKNKIFKCEKKSKQEQKENCEINFSNRDKDLKENMELINESIYCDEFIPHNIARPKPIYGQLKAQNQINFFLPNKKFDDNLILRERKYDPSYVLNNKMEIMAPTIFNMTDVSYFSDSLSQSKMNSTGYLKSNNCRKNFRDILLKPQPDFYLKMNSNLNLSVPCFSMGSQSIFPLSVSPLPSESDHILTLKTESSKVTDNFYKLINQEYQNYFHKRDLSFKNPILTIKDYSCFSPKL